MWSLFDSRLLLISSQTRTPRKVLFSATFRLTFLIKLRNLLPSQQQRNARSKRATPHRTAHQRQEVVSQVLRRKHSKHTQPSASPYPSERSSLSNCHCVERRRPGLLFAYTREGQEAAPFHRHTTTRRWSGARARRIKGFTTRAHSMDVRGGDREEHSRRRRSRTRTHG